MSRLPCWSCPECHANRRTSGYGDGSKPHSIWVVECSTANAVCVLNPSLSKERNIHTVPMQVRAVRLPLGLPRFVLTSGDEPAIVVFKRKLEVRAKYGSPRKISCRATEKVTLNRPSVTSEEWLQRCVTRALDCRSLKMEPSTTCCRGSGLMLERRGTDRSRELTDEWHFVDGGVVNSTEHRSLFLHQCISYLAANSRVESKTAG